MPVKGTDVVLKNIVAFGGGFLRTVDRSMEKVRDVLDEKVTKNISLTDHSLADLAKLGHPYARRHGYNGLGLHDPTNYQVHKQSGKLLRSKFKGTKKASVNNGAVVATAFVGLNGSAAPHAFSVVYGTSKMIPRPVLQMSRIEAIDEASEIIRNDLRSATFSFRGSKT